MPTADKLTEEERAELIQWCDDLISEIRNLTVRPTHENEKAKIKRQITSSCTIERVRGA